VYETPDTFTSSRQDVRLPHPFLFLDAVSYAVVEQGNSSDEDGPVPQRGSGFRGRNAGGDAGPASREELDSSSLMGAEAAGRKFRKAEKRRGEHTVSHGVVIR
jgi:hypothetical protein